MSTIQFTPGEPVCQPFAQELALVMHMVLDGRCICAEPDRARSAFQCPVHQEEHPL